MHLKNPRILGTEARRKREANLSMHKINFKSFTRRLSLMIFIKEVILIN